MHKMIWEKILIILINISVVKKKRTEPPAQAGAQSLAVIKKPGGF